MGAGAGALKASETRVALLASELCSLPGCSAYHTSVLCGTAEYVFDDMGIHMLPCEGGNPTSHMGRQLERIGMGSTTVTSAAMLALLSDSFQPGSYDLLRKNCNSFTDCCLSILVGKRLDRKYRQLESVGANFPQLVSALSGRQYDPNPLADGFDLEALCKELEFGRPAWAAEGEKIDERCEGAEAKPSPQARRRGAMPTLQRVLILPFADTFEFNYDHMYRNHILPYVQSAAVADAQNGRGLHPGDEFSSEHGRVRFRVVSCEPRGGGLPTGNTTVLYEGDPIQRTLLETVTVLPLESSMALLEGKASPSALKSEFVGPFLEQRSAELKVGEVLTIGGAKFKVTQTEPKSGGGPCVRTVVKTEGPAVRCCSAAADCVETPSHICREKGCKRLVCKRHAADVKETSCLCPAHAPKPRGIFSWGRKGG